MAQPAVGSSSALDGLGTAASAYGYVMSGTTVTACAAVSIVSTTLLTSNVFTGGRYQSQTVTATLQGSTTIAAATINTSYLGYVGGTGNGGTYSKATTTVQAFAAAIIAISPISPTPSITGHVTVSSQHYYYDFI